MRGELYIIPDPERIEDSLALAVRWGAHFEYNDFFDMALADDPRFLEDRIAFYKSLDRDRSRDTLHGAFLDVTVHSDDPRIRRVSEERVRQSMDTARKLGVRGVVFHTGLIANYHSPYYDSAWLDRNRSFWTDICAEYPEIEVYMENMFDSEPDRLMRLAELMRDTGNFGVCLDAAHARVFGGGIDGWFAALAPYVRHMHVNDNDGRDDLHDAVGDGVIDWAAFDRAVAENNIAPSVLIETSSIEKQRRSLEYMEERGIYPF